MTETKIELSYTARDCDGTVRSTTIYTLDEFFYNNDWNKLGSLAKEMGWALLTGQVVNCNTDWDGYSCNGNTDWQQGSIHMTTEEGYRYYEWEPIND